MVTPRANPKRLIAGSGRNLGSIGTGSIFFYDMSFHLGKLYILRSQARENERLLNLREIPIRANGNIGRQDNIATVNVSTQAATLQTNFIGASLASRGNNLEARVQYYSQGFNTWQLIAAGLAAAGLVALTAGFATGFVGVTLTTATGIPGVAGVLGGAVTIAGVNIGGFVTAGGIGVTSAVAIGGAANAIFAAAPALAIAAIFTAVSVPFVTAAALVTSVGVIAANVALQQDGELEIHRWSGEPRGASTRISEQDYTFTPISAAGDAYTEVGVLSITAMNNIESTIRRAEQNRDLVGDERPTGAQANLSLSTLGLQSQFEREGMPSSITTLGAAWDYWQNQVEVRQRRYLTEFQSQNTFRNNRNQSYDSPITLAEHDNEYLSMDNSGLSWYNPSNGGRTIVSGSEIVDELDAIGEAYIFGDPIAYDGNFLYMVVQSEGLIKLARFTLSNLTLPEQQNQTAQVGSVFNHIFTRATGGVAPYTYFLRRRGRDVNLAPPPGVTFTGDANPRLSGRVSATAVAPLRYDYDLVVRDSIGVEQRQPFSLQVNAAPTSGNLPQLSFVQKVVNLNTPRPEPLPTVVGVSPVQEAGYTYYLTARGNRWPQGFPPRNSQNRYVLPSTNAIPVWRPTRTGNFTLTLHADHRTLENHESTAVMQVVLPVQINRPPTFVLPPVVVNEQVYTRVYGQRVYINLVAQDPDNDRLTYFASGLPSGVSINSASGIISGLPADSEANQRHSVTVTVSDGRFTDSKTFTIAIGAKPASGETPTAYLPPVENPDPYIEGQTITPLILPRMLGRVSGTSYSYSFSATRGAETFNASQFTTQTGLTLQLPTDTREGQITGTAGTFHEDDYSCRLTATRVSGTQEPAGESINFTIRINESTYVPPPPVQNLSLNQPNLTYKSGDSIPVISLARVQLNGVNNDSGYTYAVSNLPEYNDLQLLAYASFNHTLFAAGTQRTWPSVAVYRNLTLIATHPTNPRLESTFSITVDPPDAPEQEVSRSSLSAQTIQGTVGESLTGTLNQVSNPFTGASYTYANSSVTIPGLTVSTTGVTGIPSRAGIWRFTRTATDSNKVDTNSPLTAQVTIRIGLPAGDPTLTLVTRQGTTGRLQPSGDYDADGREIYYAENGVDATLGINFGGLNVQKADYPLYINVDSVGVASGSPGYLQWRSGTFHNQSDRATDPFGGPYHNIRISAGIDGNPTSGTENDIVYPGRRQQWTGYYELIGSFQSNPFRRQTWNWYPRTFPDNTNLRIGKRSGVPVSVQHRPAVSIVYRATLTRTGGNLYSFIQGRRQSNNLADQGARVDAQGNLGATAAEAAFNGLTSYPRFSGWNRSNPPSGNNVLATSEIRIIWGRRQPLRWAREQTKIVSVPDADGEIEMPFVVGTVGGTPPVEMRVFSTKMDGLPANIKILGTQFAEQDVTVIHGDQEPDLRAEYGYYSFTATAKDGAGARIFKQFAAVLRRRD